MGLPVSGGGAREKEGADERAQASCETPTRGRPARPLTYLHFWPLPFQLLRSLRISKACSPLPYEISQIVGKRGKLAVLEFLFVYEFRI